MAQTDLPPLADSSSEQPEFSSLAFLILPGSAQIKLDDTTKASEFHPVPIPGKGEPKGMAFPQNRKPKLPVTMTPIGPYLHGLARGDGDHRSGTLLPGLHQSEYKHQKGKQSFGEKIPVVDPEIDIPVGNRNKGIAGLPR